MQHTTLLLLVQHTLRLPSVYKLTLWDGKTTYLRVHTTFKVPLRRLTQLKILQRHPPHKRIVLIEPVHPTFAVIVVVIKLHPRLPGIHRTDSETAHATTIQVERAYGEKEQKEAVIRLLRVRDMPAVCVVGVHFVEGGWVLDAEGAMGVLAVETLLVAVDHGFPVEATGIFDFFAVGESAEVVFVE